MNCFDLSYLDSEVRGMCAIWSYVNDTCALAVETWTGESQTLNARYWCCVSLHNLKITQDSERKAVGIIARNVCKFEVR